MRPIKNLLVTGGCGFIGTNFIRYLIKNPDFKGRIINVDCLSYASNHKSLHDIKIKYPDRYFFKNVDICNESHLKIIFESYEIDAICHFAAESHVDRSIVEPDVFVKTNIIGTFNLLELAKNYHDKFVLFHHVSTDEVYGSLGDLGKFHETSPYKPNSPYSATKASSDHLVRAYNHTYSLPVTISNCSNNYGPYQYQEKLIPLVIMKALFGKSIPVYGDGRNIRDWLYVTDHCKAIWKIMQIGGQGETYNIGANNEVRNIDLVSMICDLLDKKAQVRSVSSRRDLITFVTDRLGHDRRYAVDATKITKELGWEPEIDFQQGLSETIDWYLDNCDWASSEKGAISEYEKYVSYG
jgi:dTDP-glucose 4,6-dehydratase